MIGRQVKICTGFTQSIQILRRKKIKKIYCPMTETKYQMCIFILGHRPNHITKIFSNLQSYATAQQKK